AVICCENWLRENLSVRDWVRGQVRGRNQKGCPVVMFRCLVCPVSSNRITVST
ncbi:hypothetical protein pipiens_008223, partial [Culex pipiens pipiens]